MWLSRASACHYIRMKDVGVQASLLESPSPQVLGKLPNPDDEFPQILYQRHTIFWGALACALLYYFILNQGELPTNVNTKTGVLAAVAVLIFCGGVHLPDSHFMSRPHPALWRMLMGATFCYISFLAFLAFQPVEKARQLLAWLDPKLGVPLPERTYAADCRVFTPENPHSLFANLQDCVFDMYMAAHLIGWWIKMMIVRDVKLCWFLSIVFEFMEVSLRHQLPNFYECWWDHLILDILVCNGGGIYLGYLTCGFFEMRQYHWGVGKDIRANSGRFSTLTRSAVQLTPFSWKEYKWDLFSSPRNFIGMLHFVCIFNLVDLSNFYLKYVLWMPSSHWLLLIRALYWACMSVIVTREYYEFVYSGFREKIGTFCWLGHFALAMEWLIVFKDSAGMFTQEMPVWLKWTWSCIGLGIGLEISYLVYRQRLKGGS